MKYLFALLPLASLSLLADTIIPQQESNLSITIYNDNRAFVHDVREANVTDGHQKLVYEGVPQSVITPSVVPTFSGIETQLFSQNYIYDLISLDSMLKNSIGKPVEFYTNGDNPTLSMGTLLAYRPTVMVRQKGTGKILALVKPTQVIFSSVPKNMITRPSLVWNIETSHAGRLGIDLKYLTTGITWKSDYVLNLNPQSPEGKSLDLVGWITVNNRSGVTYPHAHITCLAGDVNRVREPRHNIRREKSLAMAVAPAPQIKEESFSGYHIYHIPFRETIANNQQKQIRFIDKTRVGYLQYGKATNSYFEKYGTQKLLFGNTIEFVNSTANRIGVPLPSGIVRLYQKDHDGATHFIGENRIHNLPEDEKVSLRIGTLFDAVGEKKITKYTARKGYRNVETTYTLRNQGKENLELRVEEIIPTYGNSIKVKTSCKGICSVKKQNAFVREFTIQLKPKEKYAFTTEFEVYY
jgi:hypothetical protein